MKHSNEMRETSLVEDVHNLTKENNHLSLIALRFQNGELINIGDFENQIQKEIKLLYELKDKVKNYKRPTIYSKNTQ